MRTRTHLQGLDINNGDIRRIIIENGRGASYIIKRTRGDLRKIRALGDPLEDN